MEYLKCTAQKPTGDNKIKTAKWSDNAIIIIYAPVHTGKGTNGNEPQENVCRFKLLFAGFTQSLLF